MPQRRVSPKKSVIQIDKKTHVEVELTTSPVPLPAPVTRTQDFVGTVCQREILRHFPNVGYSILRKELRKIMADLGHAVSTVDRSIGRLVSHGTLRSDCGKLILTDKPPPKPINFSFSRPGKQRNRFGYQADKDVVDLVRDLLAQRLDDCFEFPNSLLRRVLVAVEWAGRIASAISVGDPVGTRRAIRELQDHWGEKSLTADDLLEALQVGLFPETFAEDPRVRDEIERGIAEAQRRRDEYLARSIEETRLGDAPPSAQKFRSGLIPFAGPERCGRRRLKVWLNSVSTLVV